MLKTLAKVSRTGVVLVGALAWMACTTEQPPPPTVTETGGTASQGVDMDIFLASARAALPPGDLAPSDLPAAESAGAQAVRRYCTTCHAVPSPRMHSATDWPIVLRRMWLRIDRVSGTFDIPVPTTAERAAMVPYFVEHAFQVSERNLPPGPGRALFMQTCSRCHALADPRQHASEDWIAVARRMRQHLEDMLGDTISTDDFAQIVLYLESVSRTTE